MTTRTGNFKQTPKWCNASYSVSIIDHFALCLARFDEGPCLSCFGTLNDFSRNYPRCEHPKPPALQRAAASECVPNKSADHKSDHETENTSNKCSLLLQRHRGKRQLQILFKSQKFKRPASKAVCTASVRANRVRFRNL
jgi:hypothetical protein